MDERGPPFALVAVGGYGRRELCLESDIDMILVFDGEIPEDARAMAKDIFLPLWDQGLDLGYGVRNLQDFKILIQEDLNSFTAVLDLRLIYGDRALFSKLMLDIEHEISHSKERYIHQLTQAFFARTGQFGGAKNILEPNLKEGIGGLRDLHHVSWLLKVIYGLEQRGLGMLDHALGKDYREAMEKCYDFVRRARNILHFVSRRRNDILKMGHQDKVAKLMGFMDNPPETGVELFLGELYHQMTELRAVVEEVDTLVRDVGMNQRSSLGRQGLFSRGGFLITEADIGSEGDPNMVPELLRLCGDLNLKLGLRARNLIYKIINEEGHPSSQLKGFFKEVILSRDAPLVLEQMRRSKLLAYLIPPFKNITNKVQFDTYHLYPVDVHSVETVRFLAMVENYGSILEKTVFHDLVDKRPLFWAALLHDIGKGKGGHAAIGAGIAEAYLKGLELDLRIIEDVVFLIRNHLLFVDVATKRNINEEKVVVEVAREVSTLERAKMLYLLTWADSMATGPKAWTHWTEYLVQELFIKVLHIIEKGELATISATATSETNLRLAREYLKRVLGDDLSWEGIFGAMGIRYSLESSPEEMAGHVIMAMELMEEKKVSSHPLVMKWKEYPTDKVIRINILTLDTPGLFSKISGALTLHNFNILGARIYTWLDRTAVDIIEVQPHPDPASSEEELKGVKRDLLRAIKGELDLESAIRAKTGIFTRGSPATGKDRETKINIDNSQSDFFTLIEVYTADRIGLLYTLTKTLHQCGLDIKLAKISTKVDSVADIFYVKDSYGEKVVSQEELEKIKGALLEAIEGIGKG